MKNKIVYTLVIKISLLSIIKLRLAGILIPKNKIPIEDIIKLKHPNRKSIVKNEITLTNEKKEKIIPGFLSDEDMKKLKIDLCNNKKRVDMIEPTDNSASGYTDRLEKGSKSYKPKPYISTGGFNLDGVKKASKEIMKLGIKVSAQDKRIKEIANNLNDMMKYRNLNPYQLAELTLIPVETIWEYQLGRKLPTIAHLKKLSEALKINISLLR